MLEKIIPLTKIVLAFPCLKSLNCFQLFFDEVQSHEPIHLLEAQTQQLFSPDTRLAAPTAGTVAKGLVTL